MTFEIHPVTPDRWDDLTRLFGPKGACGGCWCMWNRQSQREFEASKGEANREALHALVAAGPAPGLLAYEEGAPVGWVALGPREDFGRIQRSRVTKPVDDLPVWSIVCFVIDRNHRRRRLGSTLLGAAVDHAAAHGAGAVEGYPVEPRADRVPDVFAWMGLASMFVDAGFTEIARRSPGRPVFRKLLGSGS